MAQSASINFEPLLHNITPDKVVFCYRSGDADSLEIAEYYRSVRGIPANHLIPLPCSNETNISESEYEVQIEYPLLSKLSDLGEDFNNSGQQREIWVIILGYNVPIAFYSDEEDPYNPENLIAIASRLHRLSRAREDRYPNPTYDRRGNFKYFDADDSDEVYLVSVINGPTKQAAKKLIQRSIIVDNLSFVTGKVLVDPYGKKSTDKQIQYQNDILDFVSNELPNLGLESTKTFPTIDESDPFITSMAHDAFYFGWFTPRYSKSLFLNQNEKRVFLYNADDDSASFLRESLNLESSNSWCSLAINIEPGYAATAGALASPGEDSYLRPRPFFETLHRGATLGEAFLFASPVVDWRIILIGDPLLVVNFPTNLPDDQNPAVTTIPNHEAIRRIKESLEEALAYGRRQSRLTEETFQRVLLSSSLPEEINLLHPTRIWRDIQNPTAQNNLLTRSFDAFMNYILRTENMTFEGWLVANNEKTTQFVNELLSSNLAQGSVGDEFVHDEGHWNYDFIYRHVRNTLENIYFQVHIGASADFSSVVIDVNSYIDIEGWEREIEPYIFTAMIDTGLPSNFSGRKIRFISGRTDQTLRRTEIYYVRWRPLDRNGVPIADWTVENTPLIIKR